MCLIFVDDLALSEHFIAGAGVCDGKCVFAADDRDILKIGV